MGPADTTGTGEARTEPTARRPLLVLVAPPPTRVPEEAKVPGVLWSGTSTISGGSLEDGVLIGSNSYCFKPSPAVQCSWDSSEPFVWTEQSGMVVLDRLEGLGARFFFPTFVSSDGETVVGSFHGDRNAQGYFRWTRQEGATTLGEPPGTGGGPKFMSRDGRTVAGMAKIVKPNEIEHAEFLWTVADGFQPLAANGSWPSGAEIMSLSADGATLVGQTSTPPKVVFRWTVEGGAQALGSLPGRPSCAVNRATKDAEVVFGSCQDSSDSEVAFRWSRTSGMVPLMTEGGAEPCYLYPFGLSEDGSIAFGNGRCGAEPSWVSARWSADAGVVALPPATKGRLELPYDSVSRDGAVAFGLLVPAGASIEDGRNGSLAFRWSSVDGLEPLGFLAGHRMSAPSALDARGSVLVGRSGVENYSSKAVLWDAVGLLDIAEYLQSQGTDLQGTHLESADRVVTRGDTVVVQGLTDVRQGVGAWIAWLPSRN